ncbi:MAG: hypothetical protein IJV65_09570 [Kiritimatiellae bacterium]|nr:hypothetical protein [Kiritimatiellia bacterium]
MNAFARVRSKLGPLWGPALILFFALRFGDFVNAAVGLWLVPRFVPAADLRAVQPLVRVAAFVATPLSILLVPYAKLLNVHAVRGEAGKVKALIRDASLLALASLLLALLATPLFFRLVFRLWHIENGRLALAIVASSMVGALSPVFTETLRALGRFGVVSWSAALSGPLRFAVMALALPVRGLTGYFVGQASAPAFQSGVAAVDFFRRHRGVRAEPYWREDRRVFLAFGAPLALSALVGNFRAMLEAMPLALVPEAESVAFYYLTTFTEIASYAGVTVVFVLFPVVSARHERGQGTARLLAQSMAVTLAGGLAVSLLLALAGAPLLRAVGAGAHAAQAKWFFPLGALAAVRTASACFTTHEAACSRFRYLRYAIPVALLETAGLLLLLRGPAWIVPSQWRFRGVFAFMAFNALSTFACILADLALRARRARAATRAR